MKKVVLSLVFLSFLNAYFHDGNRLYEMALDYQKSKVGNINTNWTNAHKFIGYIEGIRDNEGIQLFPNFCMPGGTDSGQLGDIVFRYLDNHPEERNQEGAILVKKALKEVYPCSK